MRKNAKRNLIVLIAFSVTAYLLVNVLSVLMSRQASESLADALTEADIQTGELNPTIAVLRGDDTIAVARRCLIFGSPSGSRFVLLAESYSRIQLRDEGEYGYLTVGAVEAAVSMVPDTQLLPGAAIGEIWLTPGMRRHELRAADSSVASRSGCHGSSVSGSSGARP